jgi:hypothetical protein
LRFVEIESPGHGPTTKPRCSPAELIAYLKNYCWTGS